MGQKIYQAKSSSSGSESESDSSSSLGCLPHFLSCAGFLDWVPKKMQRVGCMELLNTVQRRVQPKVHVFGHIHEGKVLIIGWLSLSEIEQSCPVAEPGPVCRTDSVCVCRNTLKRPSWSENAGCVSPTGIHSGQRGHLSGLRD